MSANLKEISTCILGNVNKYAIHETKHSPNYHNAKRAKASKRPLLHIYD